MNPIRHHARLTVELLEEREVPSATQSIVSYSYPVQGHPGNAQAAALLGLDELRAEAVTHDLDGRGLAVVVIDTGIDVNHPFFGPDGDGNGVADRIVYQWDFANKDADASDRTGHGS